MLEYIEGEVKELGEGRLALRVGPFALSIQVPSEGIISVGSQVKLYLFLYWNQETGPSLYGFQSKEDKQIFELLLSCSGIGPKVGLALLAEIGSSKLVQAVQAEDYELLSTVSGIGPKKAEQIGVQLKHKVAKLVKKGFTVSTGAISTQWQEVSQVLTSLRYSHKEVSAAMHHITEQYGDQEVPFDGLVRHALSFLAKKG